MDDTNPDDLSFDDPIEPTKHRGRPPKQFNWRRIEQIQEERTLREQLEDLLLQPLDLKQLN